jgi:hypothetical protein
MYIRYRNPNIRSDLGGILFNGMKVLSKDLTQYPDDRVQGGPKIGSGVALQPKPYLILIKTWYRIHNVFILFVSNV